LTSISSWSTVFQAFDEPASNCWAARESVSKNQFSPGATLHGSIPCELWETWLPVKKSTNLSSEERERRKKAEKTGAYAPQMMINAPRG